jgi:threonine synthase
VGVQSEHANPVFNYYREAEPEKRTFSPVRVSPSVAQAAMIGNPVSMPRVIRLVDQYNTLSGRQNIFIVEVDEQAIMDWALLANRNGHIACTHGGESLAGLVVALKKGFVGLNETAIVDSTAHALKFSGFQEMYFNNSFPEEFEIAPRAELINSPVYICPKDLDRVPGIESPLKKDELKRFVSRTSQEIANALDLRKIDDQA